MGAVMARNGDWLQTFTGGKFWPLDPRPEDVDIRDIAHALSLQCRFGGHCLRFYSVAEHCVLLAGSFRDCHTAVQLDALMHDAAEAYCADVPRPLKRFLPSYAETEAGVMRAIATAFGLHEPMLAAVKEADNRILADEKAQNLAPLDWDLEPGPALGVTLQFWSPAEAEQKFLWVFHELTSGAWR